MGYETVLHLVDVKIKADSLPIVERALANPNGRVFRTIRDFLECAVIDSEGFLTFKTSDDLASPYEPDDDDTVPGLIGDWYDSEKIAKWLKRHSEKDGRLIQHSCEGDADALGMGV